MKIKIRSSFRRMIPIVLTLLITFSCERKKQEQLESELASIDLLRGEITLCGSGNDEFGTVAFSLSCSERVRTNFNLATALLHSFEYSEAEKVFAKVIDEDPECVMAYWGAAMCNFHPLWAPPDERDLIKGSKLIALGRSLVENKSSRESDYLEAIATIYDEWDILDYRTRLLKFEKASQINFEKYPDDSEAAIFYALALNASADPKDKSFYNQRKAGEILNAIYVKNPDHPGIAHYIIHNFDYPELADQALPAARKYASIAAASAHAQHMPSHIFTRLGLWDESVKSNINSISAAQCYAQNTGIKGHWDEELHGMDYLTYAYLQQGNDEKAFEQLNYLATIDEVFPQNFKDAYCFAAMPARYALERRDWDAAANLELGHENFPWEKFLWEKANIIFARLLGAVHTNKPDEARNELNQLVTIHTKLSETKEDYKANLVLIQIKTSEGWIKLKENRKEEAVKLMVEAADMEDTSVKHPVTPGEVIPARELLGDLYMEMGDYPNAIIAYEADLKRHPNRFNGLYGAGRAEEKSGNIAQAKVYYEQLLTITNSSGSKRSEIAIAEDFIKRHF